MGYYTLAVEAVVQAIGVLPDGKTDPNTGVVVLIYEIPRSSHPSRVPAQARWAIVVDAVVVTQHRVRAAGRPFSRRRRRRRAPSVLARVRRHRQHG